MLSARARCMTWHEHSGQTTGHSREHARVLSTSGQIPSSSHKIPRSTSATRAISVLSSIILPLQTFFSRVLLLRQQPFSSENLPPERQTTAIAIKTQVFMFRYELVNSTRKFTIVAEIVSLLKKICKRDDPFRAVFKIKTLAVLFSAYPREMKHIPRNLNLPPFCRCLFLWKWCNPFPRTRARLKHAHSFDRCGRGMWIFVLSKDAQKQLARTSLELYGSIRVCKRTIASLFLCFIRYLFSFVQL